MRKTRKWIAVTLLAFSIPAMAADAKLSGSWKLVSDINGTTRVSACTFTQDGANVKRVCKREDITREFSGAVDEKGVHLTAKAEYEGTPINVPTKRSSSMTTPSKARWMLSRWGRMGSLPSPDSRTLEDAY
jgi:hypothetical protein